MDDLSAPFPAAVAGILASFTDGLAATGLVEGLYLYGSLTTGDYSPARSDIDLVAVPAREPSDADLGPLRALHERVADAGGPARRLNCLYAVAGTLADAERLRTYWYGDSFTESRLKLMTMAELAHSGRALLGQWPPAGLGQVTLADLQDAVRAELAGYWQRVADRPDLWRQDLWVDFGLVMLPRAAALLRDGKLITKSAAIRGLADFGVPAPLAEQIRRRRAGEEVCISEDEQLARSHLARRLMIDGIRELTRPAFPA
jgi:hypothetical protein